MKNKEKGISIKKRTVNAMLLVIVIQILIIAGAVAISGVTKKLETNEFKIFSQTVKNRADYVKTFLNFMTQPVEEITLDYETSLTNTDFDSEKEAMDFWSVKLEDMKSLLRETKSTGAFIILNKNTKDTNSYSSLYIVDNDPNQRDARSSRDINLLRGPKEILKDTQITPHESWEYTISLEGEQKDIFDQPYSAGLDYKKSNNLGYWYFGDDFYEGEKQMLAYVKPIFTKNQEVVGVLGVEISQDYLYSILPTQEISENGNNGYFLAKENEIKELVPVLMKGSYTEVAFDSPIKLKLVNEEEEGYIFRDNKNIASVKKEIQIYEEDSPYRYNPLYLVAFTDMEGIKVGSYDLIASIVIAFALSLLLSVVAAQIISKHITNPTKNLIEEIVDVKAGKEISFEKTGITEIDALAESVENLNKNVLESVIKTDKIISMVDTDIGFFAFNFKDSEVDISPSLIKMFALEKEIKKDGSISMEVMMLAIEKLKHNKVDENIYKLTRLKTPKWFKLESIATENGELGVVIDVTKDEIIKQSLIYERDYDMLTGLYNRFAFHIRLNKLFEEKNFDKAAFAMGDLDNLKHINDTYGHDAGDLYIKYIANFLKKYLQDKKALYARMSGDEFYIFVYGYETKEEIAAIFYDLNTAMGNEYVPLPDETKFRLRMSMGIAWYPNDSKTMEELIRFSDFAMYQGKHSIKGSVREFDREIYNNESYFFTGKEELVTILDNQLFDYVFQPIVVCKTGEVYGYEALVRPNGKTINTPEKLINLAKAQGQLWKVEKNTFYTVLELAKRYKKHMQDKKIFINSVPNQVLKEMEYEDLHRNYKDIISNLVIEITENENINNASLNRKKSLIKTWNSMIAIDDFGNGYANETLLVNLKPNIIKIDRFLIDQIEISEDKYKVVKTLVDFAHENDILVIAEGVETKSQTKVVLELGIDMLQGFFVSYPIQIPDFDPSVIKMQLEELRKTRI